MRTIEVTSYKDQKARFHIRTDREFDERIVKDVWLNNPYLCRGQDISPGDRVIDIGAHIGSFTILAALQGAWVTAFEPHPENFKLLLRNLNLNRNMLGKRVRSVAAFQKAVSLTSGKGKLWLGVSTGGHNLYKHKRTKAVDVPLVSLNEILRNVAWCDLLKMDCEGMEFELLLKSDLSKVSRISVEWHGSPSRVLDLMKHLTEKGFIITWFNNYVPTQGMLHARKVL